MSTFIGLVIVIVIVAIAAYVLSRLFGTIREFIWGFKWQGIRDRLEVTAMALEPEIRVLVERRAREHSLKFEGFLTIEEYSRRAPGRYPIQGGPIGWVFAVNKGKWPATPDIEIWIEPKSKWPYEDAVAPQGNWSVAEQFMFDVYSPRPGLRCELSGTTNSLDVAEIGPIIERIFAKYGL